MNKYITKIVEKLSVLLVIAKRYKVIAFIVFLAIIYSFLIFRINSLSGQQPSDSEVSAQTKSLKAPHVDKTVVDKIQQLQDNSVQVKSLFNGARKNPFSE